MSILNGTLRVARWALPAALALSATASWAAISVSDVAIAPKTGDNTKVVITYRLNEPATSVDIAISNGTHLAGGTLKGVNNVEYAPPAGGLTGTITATAPAEAGAGGAVQLVPAITPATINPEGIAWFKRAASPQRDHFVAESGYTLTGSTKKIYLYAADGTVLVDAKDVGTYGSGSYPFGLAVGQNDPADHVYVSSRSTGYVQIFNPTTGPYDLTSDVANYRLPNTSNTFTGLSVTPVGSSTTKFNVWIADNKTGGLRLHTADYSTTPPTYVSVAQGIALSTGLGTTNGDIIQVAVDPTNQVLFKCMLDDGGVATNANLAKTDPNDPNATKGSTALQKWTSADGGATWQADYTWCENVIGASGIPSPATVGALGVAMDKGFDASNLANSYVWVSVGGGTVRSIYHVRASDGTIVAADTIDLTTLVTTGSAISTLYPRKLDVSRTGNIALEVGGTGNPANGTPFWTVLAPNTTGPTTDTSQSFAVAVPLLVTAASTNHTSVGNSGTAQTTYSVTVYDPSGITADNVQGTINLTQIGGLAAQGMSVAVGSDPNTGTLTYTYTVPSTAPAGSFDLPVHVTANGSKSVNSSINQGVYNAYKPNWALTTDAGVNSSPAVAGKYAYIGSDGGSIYAFDATSGAPIAAFGNNGVVNVGEPVKGKLAVSDGKLFAAGTAHVFIMDAGTGRGPVSGANPVSVAIATPSLALVPNSTFATVANKLYVGGGDNKVHVLNASTGTEIQASADLGARVYRVAVGPTTAVDGSSNPLGYVVVAGTDTFTDLSSVVGGRIHLLNPVDLTDLFPLNTTAVFVDSKGAVKSQAAFGKDTSGANYFAIGGASGLWAINADTGVLLGDGVDIWGTTNNATSAGANGNPYATSTPVDANPVVGKILPSTDSAISFGTTGGSLFGISANTGARFSYAGDPAGLPTAGGFAEGGGVLTSNNTNGGTAIVRMVYAGSDASDKKFFAQLRDQEGSAYVVTPDKKYIFDASDTLTFPASLGYLSGAFNSTPAMACGNVVVGSAPASGAGKVYGFPSIIAAPICVSAIDPLPGAYSVPAAKVVRVTYSGEINSFALGTDNLRLYTVAGTQVTGQVAQDPNDSKTVMFTPDSALAANTAYYFDTSGVQDAASAPIPDFTSTFNTGPAPVTIVKGDVNGDKTFNAEDVKMALKIAAGLTVASKDAVTAGDLYKSGSKAPDGKVTIEDALFLNRVLAGKDSLP